MFPSIPVFDFYIVEAIFDFLGPNGLFFGSMWGSKTVLGSTHVVERCSFSMIP